MTSKSELAYAVTSGLAATAVYTATSAGLRKLDPGQAAGRVRVASPLHWGYGVWGGVLRMMLVRRGVTGVRADLAQLAIFWLPWRVLAPAPTGSRREQAVAVSRDLTKHVVYVAVSRLTWDLLIRRD